MKLLTEKYKTYEGARKRAAFENGVARSEFEHGLKAKHYCYSVVAECDAWRVARETVKRVSPLQAERNHAIRGHSYD